MPTDTPVEGHSRFTDGDWVRESLVCTGNHLFNPILDPQIGKWPETLLNGSLPNDPDARLKGIVTLDGSVANGEPYKDVRS